MNRSESLFAQWSRLSGEAESAILAYDAGRRKAGMTQMEKIWQEFQSLFAEEEDRGCLQNAYSDMMSLMLNRMYVELEESAKEEVLWDFCRRVCDFFKAGEIWREDQVLCLGRMFCKQDRLEECDQWFQICRKEEPENPVYMAAHAECKTLMDMTEDALDILNIGLLRYPKCSYISRKFYRKAVRLYQNLGQSDKVKICQQRIGEFIKSSGEEDEETDLKL